jgi:hypothetical protein
MSLRYVCRCFWVLILLFTFREIFAQQIANPTEREIRQSDVRTSADWNRNGIAVGRPKVFDSRTLTLMLESLKQNLRNMQYMDQKSVNAALGNLQVYRITDSAFAASISGPHCLGSARRTLSALPPDK